MLQSDGIHRVHGVPGPDPSANGDQESGFLAFDDQEALPGEDGKARSPCSKSPYTPKRPASYHCKSRMFWTNQLTPAGG